MGQALLDGNLKRKAFQKGFYYLTYQTELGGTQYNIVNKYKTLDEAKSNFEKVNNTKYAKVLVDGTTGRLLEQAGPKELVGQNLIYMYQHVEGKVYNGRLQV